MTQHTAPSDKIFNEIKEAAIDIWKNKYSDEFGYVTEKITYINSYGNIGDNGAIPYRMFDFYNQIKLMSKLSSEAQEYILNNL